MKFRAVFSDSGVNILARRFLPCVEKFGRSVKLLLTDTDVIFLQSAAEADGLIVSVQLPKDLVFRDYEIKSAHGNKIGLRLDAGLLLKVLRANEANDADHLDVKLVKRRYPGSQELHPFLSFNSKGVNVSMVQDLPVSPPLPRGDIDAGLRAADPNPVPYFLDLHRDLARVQAVVDRGRSIEDTLQLATTRSGSLHLRVSVPAVDLGTEIQGFQVFPSEMEAPEEGAGAGSTPASRTSISAQNRDFTGISAISSHEMDLLPAGLRAVKP